MSSPSEIKTPNEVKVIEPTNQNEVRMDDLGYVSRNEAKTIFVEYVHEQTKLNLPVDASAAAALIISKGVPFQKTKENKDLLISLFNTYKELYTLLQHLSVNDLNIDYVSALPIVTESFLPILPDLIFMVKREREKEDINNKADIPSDPLPSSFVSSVATPTVVTPVAAPGAPLLSVSTTAASSVATTGATTGETTGATGASMIPPEPPKQYPRDGIDRSQAAVLLNEAEHTEKMLKEQLAPPLFSPIPEAKDADRILPDVDTIQLSYGIDTLVAQYRDLARDIRYTFLTHVDLYKDTSKLNYLEEQITRALKRLGEELQSLEQSKGFVEAKSYLSKNTIVSEYDNPTQAYEVLISYYEMLQELLSGLMGKHVNEAYTSLFSHLQHHLASLRTKSPAEISEYKQLVRIIRPIPAQRVLYISKAVNQERKGLLATNTSPVSELVNYALLASIDNNPYIVIQDPTMEILFSTIYLPLDSPFRKIVELSPEQRLQFIQLVHSKQPFDHVIRTYQQRPLVSIIPLLVQFIEDNAPTPDERCCSGLEQFFPQELQFVQSDLKKYIELYGENVRDRLIDDLKKKYNCELNDSQKQQIQSVLDEGIKGQLFLLDQLFVHYPQIVSDEVYQQLINGLTKQYTYQHLSNESSSRAESGDEDGVRDNNHPFAMQGVKMRLEEAKISPLQFLHEFIEDEQLPAEKLEIKHRLQRLRDFFNHSENRTKVYHALDLVKKRHIDISNRDKTQQYKKTIIDLFPDEEDPLRVFLLNFLDLYGSLDKLPQGKDHQTLQLSRLRHLPLSIQQEAIKRASLFLLQASAKIEKGSYSSAKDVAILNHIEYLLYSPQRDAAIPFIEERLSKMVLHTSLQEHKEEIERLKEDFLRALRAKQLDKAKEYIQTFRTLLRAKIMKDPFYSSCLFRQQRIKKRTLAERVASRLPPVSPMNKQLLLWYLLKPWMDSLSHTEYRNFEYFIALPTNVKKESTPPEVSRFFGTRLPPRDLGFVYDTYVYRPTIDWWNYIISRYHTTSGKCKNTSHMVEELTIEGGTKQRFIIGIFSPGYAARVFTSSDLLRECKWFDDHFTHSQTQFVEWLHKPATELRSSIQPYVEKMVNALLDEKQAIEKEKKEAVLSSTAPRHQLKAKAFANALFVAFGSKSVGELLEAFFTVYTFLSKHSIVHGYGRIILDTFSRASPEWYPYLLKYSISELFPELTLVDPDVKEQIKRLIKDYVQSQIKQMYAQAHPSILTSDIAQPQHANESQLTHLLEHEVRPYVQTKWCPIDKSIVWFLAKDGEETVKCAEASELENTPYIPTNVVQAIKAQLASSDQTGKKKDDELDLTIDTDIEMTAIRHFTEILRDATLRSGEFSASRLAREISKAHPHPISGKQLPIEPIRESLQTIAEEHFLVLEKKIINQYVNCHPEIFVQFQAEREARYKKYALIGSELEVAENDFNGRRRILGPLIQLIKTSFELEKIDEDQVVSLVSMKLYEVDARARKHADGDESLPELCGMCHAPTTPERLSLFYINGLPEPEFFCSLDCADKRMLKFQKEPTAKEVALDADHDLFHQLLKYYPSRGFVEPGEHGLYIPDQDILLQFEERMRQLATTISVDLTLEFELEKLYRGLVGRYRKAYEDIIHEKESRTNKFSVEVVDGCDISMKQLRDFFTKVSSKYYDQLVDGTFSFLHGLMVDFYRAYPVCEKLPDDVLEMMKQYKIVTQLGYHIEKAYRQIVVNPSESQDQFLKRLQQRLADIYKWRYLREAKKLYPYLSDADHLVKAAEQFKLHPVEKDIELCLQFINRHAPIGQRIKTPIDFLREVDRVAEKASGQNRLQRLLRNHQVDISVSAAKYERAIALMLQIGNLFPDELRTQIRDQHIVVRNPVSVVSRQGGEVKLRESLFDQPLIGISRKRNRQTLVEDFGTVKEDLTVGRSKAEQEVLDRQLLTLRRTIDQEMQPLLLTSDSPNSN